MRRWVRDYRAGTYLLFGQTREALVYRENGKWVIDVRIGMTKPWMRQPGAFTSRKTAMVAAETA